MYVGQMVFEKLVPTSEVTVDFALASHFENRHRTISAHIDAFLKSLSHFKTEDDINTHNAEKFIKRKFINFLDACEYRMAKTDFEELLTELSGKNRRRDDGTISWYHQLSPIINILSMIQSGIIKLSDLDTQGGLEILMRTHLRHDTFEDFGVTFEQFAQRQAELIKKNARYLKDFSLRKTFLISEGTRANRLLSNLKLMTKAVAETDEDGQVIKGRDRKIKNENYSKEIRIIFIICSKPVQQRLWFLS